MAKKPTITAKPLELTIGGKKYQLEVTLAAIRTIDRDCGGILPAWQGVRNRNVDVTVAVLAAGAGMKLETQQEIDDFTMEVYGEDVDNYVSALNKYMGLLMSGGKEPETGTDEEGPGGNA